MRFVICDDGAGIDSGATAITKDDTLLRAFGHVCAIFSSAFSEARTRNSARKKTAMKEFGDKNASLFMFILFYVC